MKTPVQWWQSANARTMIPATESDASIISDALSSSLKKLMLTLPFMTNLQKPPAFLDNHQRYAISHPHIPYIYCPPGFGKTTTLQALDDPASPLIPDRTRKLLSNSIF